MNSDFIHRQATGLSESIDSEKIGDAEVVRRAVRAVLARGATTKEVDDGMRLIQELQSESRLSRQRAVELYCLTVMNWNEFLFLD
jgi:hypothetical protein